MYKTDLNNSFIFREGLTYTNWDRWDVYGNKDFTLQQFLDYFKVCLVLFNSYVFTIHLQ